MFSDVINQFEQDVDPRKTRIEAFPSLVFVFGGRLSLEESHTSLRNVFVQWAQQKRHPISERLYSPEDFDEWNSFDGYSNLIEFERDAISLSRGIILFSESAGAYAELGAFSMDYILSERMMIVVQRAHYEQTSFIRLGPIKKIEEMHDDSSVYVLNAKSPKEFEELEVQHVADALMERIESAPKSAQFNAERTRDQLLLIADLVELFGALALSEIETLFKSFVPSDDATSQVKRMLHQLCFFDLIKKVKASNRTYYVVPTDRRPYMNYISGKEKRKFERGPTKMSIFEALRKDSSRFRAYQEIHGAYK